jgi:hypothetical protein
MILYVVNAIPENPEFIDVWDVFQAMFKTLDEVNEFLYNSNCETVDIELPAGRYFCVNSKVDAYQFCVHAVEV